MIWTPPPSGKRGRQQQFSDAAIHASIFSQASCRLMNQCVFRHSLLSFELKASMKALSVGLPGREKSSVTPR
jgi:hypothetical protein